MECDESDICDWSIETSTFDKHVFNKKNFAFLIATEDGIRYGGFLYSTIDKNQSVDVEGKIYNVFDAQSFLFSFKDNKPMKYELKEDKKSASVFDLFEEWHERLFVFGDDEILIGKKGKNMYSQQNNDSLFFYKGNENALTGKTGWKDKDMINVK